jgi:hypothetical protein
MARSAASVGAPAASAKAAPFFSATLNGGGDIWPSKEPLSPMAPAIRPLACGLIICALTENEPADSPAMVTRAGSPPKAAMFFFTHCSAAAWSIRP